MKTILTLLMGVCFIFGFTPKNDPTSNLIYQLNNLTRSFVNNANRNDCEYYFREIDSLKDDIQEAINDEEGDLQTLRKLQKKTKALYEFAATLTRCRGTSNELDIANFNSFIEEVGLSPVLVKRNSCASIYKVNINGFITYYAVNSSSESKALKIAVPGSTSTMNIMCNSVEGFSQGQPLRQINSVVVTCTSANLKCY